MAAPERSIASILQGILDNLQELVHSELTLVRRELAEDVARGRAAAVVLAAGAVLTLVGFQFLLWSAVYALALRLPIWSAALIVGAVLLAVGGVAVSIGLKRWTLVAFTPERSVVTMKETVAWVRQSSS